MDDNELRAFCARLHEAARGRRQAAFAIAATYGRGLCVGESMGLDMAAHWLLGALQTRQALRELEGLKRSQSGREM